MKHALVFIILNVAALLCCAADDAAVIQATSSSPIYPILLRNEHGPLVRIVVDVADATAVEVKAVEFQLEGTDEIADLESLTLFRTGDDETFSAENPFGDPAQPAATVTFRGQQTLNAGKNVLWLSARLKDTATLSHNVSAACTKIETNKGHVSPKNRSPGVLHRIGVALRKHQDKR